MEEDEDVDANPDALQWEGAYCSTAEDASDVLGTGGVVSVTGSTQGLPKLDSSYPKEDDVQSLTTEQQCYKYNKDCEQEFDPTNVPVHQLVVKDMGHKCSPKEFLHTDEINRTDDVIPVGEHGNAELFG